MDDPSRPGSYIPEAGHHERQVRLCNAAWSGDGVNNPSITQVSIRRHKAHTKLKCTHNPEPNLMDGQIAEVTEEDDIGVGGFAVHADTADGVLVHRGGVGLATVTRASHLRRQKKNEIDQNFVDVKKFYVCKNYCDFGTDPATIDFNDKKNSFYTNKIINFQKNGMA